MAYELDELRDILEDEGFYIREVLEGVQYFTIWIGDEMQTNPRQDEIYEILDFVYGSAFNMKEAYISGYDVVVEIDN